MVILAGVVVGFLFDSKYKFTSILAIKFLEMSITRHSKLLKENSDANQVPTLNSRLLSLFRIYETNIARPISLVRLFSGSIPSNQNELSEYELIMKEKLSSYYTLFQNVRSYNIGNITMTELIKRMK